MKDNWILKQRYFALYWGQEVGRIYRKRPNLWKFYVSGKRLAEIDYLVLKPHLDDVDYDTQRALGHATPFMNYSINDLIEAGWLVIEE